MKRLIFVAMLSLVGMASADDATPQPPRQHEVLTHRPSGFWTSNRPAVGGAYRWRLLGLGVVIAALTGVLMVRVVRNTRGPSRR